MADSRSESSGLLGIGTSEFEELALSDDLRWLAQRLGKFVKGGIYLIAGQPGIGKSTLGIQLAVDLARSGKKTLYILTEQSKEELAHRARLITSNWTPSDVTRSLPKIEPEDSVYDIETLPSFLSHQVIGPSGKYHGVDLVVLDSVQGHGLSAAATKKYRQVYEFCRQCKSAGITVLLVAHVTKRGDIAGPKDLEHNVDCVLVMRKAMSYRPLFVPKNRFGPAILKPVPLEMNRVTTALALAPHSESVELPSNFVYGRLIKRRPAERFSAV
jgi:DNA repair protein RadA/Sms